MDETEDISIQTSTQLIYMICMVVILQVYIHLKTSVTNIFITDCRAIKKAITDSLGIFSITICFTACCLSPV